MRPITKIIIQKIDVNNSEELIENHVDSGLAMVGFHYIIESSGVVVVGRTISTIGNHTKDQNSNSIGIATIGSVISKEQKISIETLLEELKIKAPDAKDVFVLKNGEMKEYK